MGRAAETHEQIAMRSPTARLVWRHVAAAWRAFCPGHSWATSAEQDGRPSDDACRAILLGLRPDGERTLREPFALLRGVAVHEIIRHRHAVWLSASRVATRWWKAPSVASGAASVAVSVMLFPFSYSQNMSGLPSASMLSHQA